ncbi:MAG TPA: DUF2076 domain-containing protein [Sphingomicrobium sp.]|nr:DUF2076 domain-containing protein [Sphingomicrobium sp.]
MQSEERELITGLFGRLQPFESQPRDGEAEALIKDLATRQPAAPYLLVQTVLVQEQALKAAQERIAELEAKGGAAPAASGFLGSAPKIGPWGATGGASAPAAPRPSVPSTRSPLQAAVNPQQGGGGSFLRTAMATAAGVAGGALLFEGIRNMMGNNPGPFGQSAAAQPAPLLPQDSQQQAAADTNPMPDDLRSEDYDTAAYDDGDSGGSDDWA